jgi:hypothetical protein
VGTGLDFETLMKIHFSSRALEFCGECVTVKRYLKQEIHNFGNCTCLESSLERYENNSKMIKEI